MIQLSGYQADGSPDGPDGASDAGTQTVGAPPAPESDYPTGPGTRSAATRSGFGRARSWVIGIGAGLLALAAIYLIELLLTSGEIERGTTIAGVDVGGLTPDEAVAALNAQVLPRYGRPVTLDVHGEPINLDPANAGLAPDVAGSAAATDERSANPITRLTSFFRSSDFPLAVGIDQAALAASLSAIAQQIAVAPGGGRGDDQGHDGSVGGAGDRSRSAGTRGRHGCVRGLAGRRASVCSRHWCCRCPAARCGRRPPRSTLRPPRPP